MGLVYLVPVWLVFMALQFSSEQKRSDGVLRHLNSLTDRCVVEIDGRVVETPTVVIDDLKRSRLDHLSHSSGRKRIEIRIRDEGRVLVLWLYKDEYVPDKYWVFLAGDPGSRVGSFVDPALASFLARYER